MELSINTNKNPDTEIIDLVVDDDPFARKTSIARTPPRPPEQRRRANSLPEAGLDLLDMLQLRSPTKVKIQGQKRPAIGSPPREAKRLQVGKTLLVAEEDWITMRKTYDTVTRVLQALGKEVRRNINTKVEIKKAAATLTQEANKLTRLLDNISETAAVEDCNTLEETRCMKTEIAELREEINRLKRINPADPREHRKEMNIENLMEEIGRVDGFAAFERIALSKWPQEAFRTTKRMDGNPLRGVTNGDLVFVTCNKNPEEERGIGKAFHERFPELLEAEETEVEPGDKAAFAAITVVVGGLKKDGARTSSKRSVIRLRAEKEEDSKKRAERMYSLLSAIRDRRDGDSSSNILMPFPEGLSPTIIRKMLECIFSGSNTNIILYGTNKDKNNMPPIPSGGQKRTKIRKGGPEIITLAAEGLSYADLLRKVRNEAEIKNAGANILSARRSEGGKLLLTTRGSEKEIEDLKQKLREKLGGVDVKHRVRQKGRLIQVRDIDALATKEEIEDAFREALRDGEEDGEEVKVLSVRPSAGDTQSATVQIAEKDAAKIENLKRLQIGPVRCRIRLRVDVICCYRCWEVGHLARNCGGANREGQCRRCGTEGHVARLCQEDPHCPLCNIGGHSAGNMGCPLFRKAIDNAREAERPGRRGEEASQWTP